MKSYAELLTEIYAEPAEWKWFKKLSEKWIARARVAGKLYEIELYRVNGRLWNMEFRDPAEEFGNPLKKLNLTRKLELFNTSFDVMRSFLEEKAPKYVYLDTDPEYNKIHRRALLQYEPKLLSMGYDVKIQSMGGDQYALFVKSLV